MTARRGLPVDSDLVERNIVSTMTDPALDFGTPLDEMTKQEIIEAGLEVKDSQLKPPSKAKTVKTVETKGTALNAIKEEAADPNVKVFTYDGEQWTMKPTDEWDIEVFEMIEDSKLVSAVREILGAKQWARFKSKKRKVKDFSDIYDKIQEVMGVPDEDLDS
jgi:hypothetical protein